MVGVAEPLLKWDRPAGRRFLVAFGLGLMVSALVLALLLSMTQFALHLMVAPEIIVWLSALTIALLGLLDLVGHTPQLHRQTPQSWNRELRPGIRGLLYGADVGLLVSTQKATSLIWIAIAGGLVTRFMWLPLLLVVFALSHAVTVAALSALRVGHRIELRMNRRLQRLSQLSSAILAIPAVLFVVA